MNRWKDTLEVGSCNFCKLDDHRKVLEFGVLRGEWTHGGQIIVRICRKCLDALKKLANDR